MNSLRDLIWKISRLRVILQQIQLLHTKDFFREPLPPQEITSA